MSQRYRIIIVENDEDEQMFMKEGFDQSGLFEIITQSYNGDRLFEWLETHSDDLPDAILSDLNMPGKNGYDIVTAIGTSPSYQHIPVIITSTSSTRTTIDRCMQLGAADFIVKPDTFNEYVSFAKKLHRIIQGILKN